MGNATIQCNKCFKPIPYNTSRENAALKCPHCGTIHSELYLLGYWAGYEERSRLYPALETTGRPE